MTKVLAHKHGRSSHGKAFRQRIRQCAEALSNHSTRMGWAEVMSYPWHHVDADAAADYARSVHAKYTNRGSRNVYMSVLRQIVRECYRSGLISAARKYEILEELPTHRPGASSKGRRLVQVEIAALMTYCDSDGDAGVRDAAVTAVFATTGMRISELVDLELTDWDRVDDSLLLRRPKNGRPHRVYVHPVARARLLAWLEGSAVTIPARFSRTWVTPTVHMWRRGSCKVGWPASRREPMSHLSPATISAGRSHRRCCAPTMRHWYRNCSTTSRWMQLSSMTWHPRTRCAQRSPPCNFPVSTCRTGVWHDSVTAACGHRRRSRPSRSTPRSGGAHAGPLSRRREPPGDARIAATHRYLVQQRQPRRVHVPWELLCHEDYAALAWQAVADRYARATALKDAAALRALLKALHRFGLLSYEQYDSARGFPTRGADPRDPAGRYLSDADMADLVAACWGAAHGRQRSVTPHSY